MLSPSTAQSTPGGRAKPPGQEAPACPAGSLQQPSQPHHLCAVAAAQRSTAIDTQVGRAGHTSSRRCGRLRMERSVRKGHANARCPFHDQHQARWHLGCRVHVKRHRKLSHFRHQKLSHPQPCLWPCFRGGSALAVLAVPLVAYGFRYWSRWLSSGDRQRSQTDYLDYLLSSGG